MGNTITTCYELKEPTYTDHTDPRKLRWLTDDTTIDGKNLIDCLKKDFLSEEHLVVKKILHKNSKIEYHPHKLFLWRIYPAGTKLIINQANPTEGALITIYNHHHQSILDISELNLIDNKEKLQKG